jgi:hypothetical protein
MNKNSSIALSGVAVALAIGLLGLNGVFSMPSGISSNSYNGNSQNMLGHVEIVDKDQFGNIKAYRQSDNIVTNVGRTCTAVAVFGDPSTHNCGGSTGSAVPGPFSFISLGSGSTTAATSDNSLVNQLTALQRVGYTISNSTDPGTHTGAIAQSSALFTFVASSTVQESGLSDGTQSSTASHLYARQTISPINVNSGDQLTITWKVTVG